MPPDRTTIPPTALANGSIMFALGPSPTFWLPGQCSRPKFEGTAKQSYNPSRWPMTWTWTPLTLGLAIVWGVFTVGLIILLIYRSTLTMHEEESLYLDDASQHMQQEQTELLVKVNRLTVPVWDFG